MKPLPPFTFNASVSKMLRPISKGMKRVGLLKVAPRVQGKIMETESGTRFIVIEQRGRDIWRGKSKSLSEAIEKGEAGIGVDKVLLMRAMNHEVTTVMIVVEEQRRIFLTPIADFFDEELSRVRANYQGRAHRIVSYERFTKKYLGPNLQKRKRTARQTA